MIWIDIIIETFISFLRNNMQQ